MYLKNNWSEILILKCLIDTCIEETLIGCNTFKLKVILYTGKYMPPFYFRPFYPIESEQIWDRPNWIKHNQVWTNLRQDEIVCMCEREKKHVRQKKTYIEYWYVIYMKNIIKECKNIKNFHNFWNMLFKSGYDQYLISVDLYLLR